jgi:hypothetical protein
MFHMTASAVFGGLWILNFISWASDINDGIWHAFDIINCLSGLWLMIFCVFLNKRVRIRLIWILTCRSESIVTTKACNNYRIYETLEKEGIVMKPAKEKTLRLEAESCTARLF